MDGSKKGTAVQDVRRAWQKNGLFFCVHLGPTMVVERQNPRCISAVANVPQPAGVHRQVLCVCRIVTARQQNGMYPDCL